jgi:hypothetical protein
MVMNNITKIKVSSLRDFDRGHYPVRRLKPAVNQELSLRDIYYSNRITK